MVKVYVSLCEKRARNFNTVPKNLRPQVKAQIEADGYVIGDDGWVVIRPINEED